MLKFELKHISKQEYEIIFTGSNSGKLIGRALMDVDGYFYIAFIQEGGVWSPDALIEIGKVVKELNREMDEHLANYFKEDDGESFEI